MHDLFVLLHGTCSVGFSWTCLARQKHSTDHSGTALLLGAARTALPKPAFDMLTNVAEMTEQTV